SLPLSPSHSLSPSFFSSLFLPLCLYPPSISSLPSSVNIQPSVPKHSAILSLSLSFSIPPSLKKMNTSSLSLSLHLPLSPQSCVCVCVFVCVCVCVCCVFLGYVTIITTVLCVCACSKVMLLS